VRTCKVCRQKYEPARPMQTTCSIPCAIEYGTKAAEKKAKRKALAEKKSDALKKKALKPLRYWLDLAQKAFNRYVRARDFHKGCISCHLPASWDGQWHASHLRSTAAASAVRYHLWNVHKACSACNNHKSGNIAEYFPRVVALIGPDRIGWLYTQNQTVKYTREYLQRLASVFNKKAARQEARNANR
jgi:hypothetical protein